MDFGSNSPDNYTEYSYESDYQDNMSSSSSSSESYTSYNYEVGYQDNMGSSSNSSENNSAQNSTNNTSYESGAQNSTNNTYYEPNNQNYTDPNSGTSQNYTSYSNTSGTQNTTKPNSSENTNSSTPYNQEPSNQNTDYLSPVLIAPYAGVIPPADYSGKPKIVVRGTIGIRLGLYMKDIDGVPPLLGPAPVWMTIVRIYDGRQIPYKVIPVRPTFTAVSGGALASNSYSICVFEAETEILNPGTYEVSTQVNYGDIQRSPDYTGSKDSPWQPVTVP
jgi:hypothetical protein